MNNFAFTMPVSRAAADDEETLDEPEWMMEMVSKIRHFIMTSWTLPRGKTHLIITAEKSLEFLAKRIMSCTLLIEMENYSN